MDIDLIRKIDFGEIDGYGDPNLEKYFLDNGYWDKIIEDKTFFVVGKKGTGKSAVYRMIEQEAPNKGCLIINKDFGEFPFDKLLKLGDDDFAKPNQYQTIWKNVIYNLFIQAIAKLPDESNQHYKEIKNYNDTFWGSALDLHKEIISKAVKTQGSLLVHGIGFGAEKKTQCDFRYNDDNITTINSKLYTLLENYFITTDSEAKIVIQFDRLDDNYNQYQDVEEYYQAIISLFKTVYNFNQSLRAKSIQNAKVVLYIRSDIIRAMATRDAESARWDDFRIDLDWRVTSIRNAHHSNLYKMVMKRIYVSCPELKGKKFGEIFTFGEDLKKDYKVYDLFNSLILQTLFRPRDLINLLKILQNAICAKGALNSNAYNEALKKYSNWLVNTEIANEINPVLGKDYKYVLELLRLCGSKRLSVKTFTERYHAVKHDFSMAPLDLLNFLYDVGIIENIWINNASGKYMHRSIFRNEGDFDRNLNFRIFPIVWNGLTV